MSDKYPDNSLLQRLKRSLKQLESVHQLRIRRCVEAISTTECLVDGRRCVSFATNDYLGLTRHSEVVAAFADSAANQVGAGASGMISGRSPFHVRLEAAIAEFEGTESAVLFPSGFAANTGTLMSLIGRQDAVFSDRDNHASLIDGCRASAGKVFVYSRTELDQLRKTIERCRNEYESVFIVTDTVFSMDGTLADLPQLCDIADRFDASILVDEAHGTGVFGKSGRGVCELHDVEDRVLAKIGTLSKSVGSLGGFAAGSTCLCDWLWNTARSQFFSTALPPAVCAAATAALRVIALDSDRRQRLAARAEFARQLIQEADLTMITAPHESPIIAILIGDDDLALRVSRRMLEHGFFVPAIRPPSVSQGTARLRMSLCCDHSQDQIRSAVYQLREVVGSER